MGHQSYVLLRTETTVFNHPVVFPKLNCDVHLFRGPCFILAKQGYEVVLLKITIFPDLVDEYQQYQDATADDDEDDEEEEYEQDGDY